MNTDNSSPRPKRPLLTRKQILWIMGLAIANLLFSLWMGQQAYKWMPEQASAEAVMVDRLFSFMTVIGSFIFFGVVGTLLYSMVFQRAIKYDDSDGPPIEGNVTLEVVWTAIPILLVIWIATISFQTYHNMDILGSINSDVINSDVINSDVINSDVINSDVINSDVMALATAEQPNANGKNGATLGSATSTPLAMSPIEVHSRQWSWEFYYPDADISSTELHLPVNQRARFKLTSEDVLHAFYVPAFRVKQDIIPGKEIDFSFTPIKIGRYRLRDSEYSGTYFAANQTDVVVEPPEDYQQWLKTASQTPPIPAPNQALEEFQIVTQRATGFRYETVSPAPAPVVNYAGE